MKIDDCRHMGPLAIAREAEIHLPAADAAGLAGVSEEELTPKARAAFARLMDEVDRLRGELDEARERAAHLEELADQDALVPVVNRRAFVRELTRMTSYVERYGTPHSLLYFDIDGMKRINDSLGHAAGDATLTHVARLLLDHVRESDLVGRMGGDEFGVLLAQAGPSAAHVKAETLAATIRSTPLVWAGQSIRVTLSYGWHVLSAGDDPHSALSSADERMYAHKRSAAAVP